MGQRTAWHAEHLIGLEASCTLREPSQLPMCFGGGSRTSKDPCGPADISALLPDAGWRSSHVRPHQREVCSLAGGIILPLGLNPYPTHYRPAFACSLLLYPLPSQVILRLPLLSMRTAGQRAYHVPQIELAGWFRSRLFAGGATSAAEEFGASAPDHVPFWPKPVSIFGLSFVTTFSDASPGLTIPSHPGPRPP
jgi:hypothetical protein